MATESLEAQREEAARLCAEGAVLPAQRRPPVRAEAVAAQEQGEPPVAKVLMAQLGDVPPADVHGAVLGARTDCQRAELRLGDEDPEAPGAAGMAP
eukprot:6120971-Alexandrium_andersonii.AAC.1